MTIFNLSTPGVIFAHKMCSLCGGIVGLYFLLRLMLFQSVLSMFFWALAFDSVVFYTAMWDNASLIPAMVKELKDQIDMATAAGGALRNRNRNYRYWRSVSRSIPCIGVNVGGFRSIERNSTFILVDFVVSNVVSLLMAFK